MRVRPHLLWAVVVAAAFVAGRAHSEGKTARATAVKSSETLEELDALEARLAESRRWVEQNRELARRHAEVSAVTCAAAVEHVEGIERSMRRSVRRGAPPALAASEALQQHRSRTR